VVTLLFFFLFITTIDIPAALLLLFWFGMQLLNGIGSLAQTDYTGGGVAFFAHVGGFVTGMLLIRAFPERRRWRTWRSWDGDRY
jgi:membrane associated rhomboid family serine protease